MTRRCNRNTPRRRRLDRHSTMERGGSGADSQADRTRRTDAPDCRPAAGPCRPSTGSDEATPRLGAREAQSAALERIGAALAGSDLDVCDMVGSADFEGLLTALSPGLRLRMFAEILARLLRPIIGPIPLDR